MSIYGAIASQKYIQIQIYYYIHVGRWLAPHTKFTLHVHVHVQMSCDMSVQYTNMSQYKEMTHSSCWIVERYL